MAVEQEISTEAIAGAEQVLGIQYTEAERATLRDTLSAQVDLALRRRAVTLPRDVPPATRFDPRLPDFAMPLSQAFVPRLRDPGALPDDDTDIAYAPVSRLAGWIRSGAMSSERLTRIYLDRLERIAPRLECATVVLADVALQQARAADALLASGTWLGPLHGIPWGCKDILDTKGIVTGWGAEPFRDRVPEKDATVVTRLAEAGAVLVAKTTVGALAYGDIWYGGRTRSPWNLEEGSSGSSAGSGAATAAGLVGFSLGTETLGSIVAPSTRCGTTGLRPTFGRVPRTGAMPLCWTLDKIGPMCRAVDDTGLVLAAINGGETADPFSIDAPLGDDPGERLAGLRIGYYPADFEADGAVDLDRAMLDVVGELGGTLVELTRPDLPYDALMNTLFAEAAASFEDLTLTDLDDTLTWQEPGAWPNTFRRARFLSAIDHIQLDRLRRRVMQDMDAAFRGVDAMIGPCLAGPMLIITNYTGHPCLVMPVGFRDVPTRQNLSLAKARLDQGVAGEGVLHTVPHTISFYGRLFDEGTLLRIGRALEAHVGAASRRPPIG